MTVTSLLTLSQQWHINIYKTKFPRTYCELWVNDGLCRNEIYVERRARGAWKRTFQVKAQTAICAKALGVAAPVILKEQPGGLCSRSTELKEESALQSCEF